MQCKQTTDFRIIIPWPVSSQPTVGWWWRSPIISRPAPITITAFNSINIDSIGTCHLRFFMLWWLAACADFFLSPISRSWSRRQRRPAWFPIPFRPQVAIFSNGWTWSCGSNIRRSGFAWRFLWSWATSWRSPFSLVRLWWSQSSMAIWRDWPLVAFGLMPWTWYWRKCQWQSKLVVLCYKSNELSKNAISFKQCIEYCH